MKKEVFLLTLLLACLMMPILASANLVKNPGFEEGTNYWGPWGTFDFQVDPTTFHEGGFSGWSSDIQSSVWWDTQVNQDNILVEPYSWYRLSFWAKAGGPSWTRVRLTDENNAFYSLELDFRLSSGGFQCYEVSFKTTYDATDTRLSLGLGLFAGDAAAYDVWLDAVCLEVTSQPPSPTPTPTFTPAYTPTPMPTGTEIPDATPTPDPRNLILNGSFEDGKNYWGSWNDVKFEVDGNEFIDGGFSGKLWDGSSNEWWDRQLNQGAIPIHSNQWYRVSLWAKTIADKTVGLRLWSEDGGEVYGLEEDVLVRSGNWRFLEYLFKSNSTTNQARFALCVGKFEGEKTLPNIWFDAIELREIGNDYGVHLLMPSHMFGSGDPCFLLASVVNPGSQNIDFPLFVLLEISNNYWFAPSWRKQMDYYRYEYAPGPTEIYVIPKFYWPQGIAPMNNVRFWAFLADHELSRTIGDVSLWEFGWR